MGKHRVPSCNLIELRMEKIKLQTQNSGQKHEIVEIVQGERRLPLPHLYISICILGIHAPNLRQLTIPLVTGSIHGWGTTFGCLTV